MSKRVTTKTNITDKRFAITALKASGLTFEEVGSTSLRITSGPLARASIDLTTGTVTGDTDYHRHGELGVLRRDYTEAQARHLASRDGIQIKRRVENKDGSVTLKCRMISHG